MTTNRKLMILVALIAALTMLATMTGVSFAAGGGTGQTEDTTCVVGWVINHRELPVDGTKFDPQLSIKYKMEAEELNAVTAEAADTVSELDTMMSVLVDSKGYFEIEDMPADYWYNFKMQLPQDWAGIVPEADRGGVAKTGWTQLEGRDAKHCHVVVFKIKREFDVTVLKWEENQDGTVEPGEGWTITATPQGDLFAIKQTETTDANGTAVVTLTPGKWLIAETVKSGWTPVTPSSVYLTLDQYAASGAIDPVIFKNREPICYAEITVEKNGWGTDAVQVDPGPGRCAAAA